MLLACSIDAQTYFGSTVPGTLCRSGETVLFACTTTHAKEVAVCARPAGDSAFGDIRYRFGTDARVEIDFPRRPQPLGTYASGASVGDGGRGILTFLSLRHADTTYSVYHEVIDPTYRHDGATEREGVLVERAGKVLADVRCDHDAVSYAGMLADDRLFGAAVPLAKVPPSFFAQFRPTPSARK